MKRILFLTVFGLLFDRLSDTLSKTCYSCQNPGGWLTIGHCCLCDFYVAYQPYNNGFYTFKWRCGDVDSLVSFCRF